MDGDREELFATILCMDNNVLELEFAGGGKIKLINEEYLRK